MTQSKQSPYNRAPYHFTGIRELADTKLIPIYEEAINLMLNYFGMPVGDWRLMQVISLCHVDEDRRVYNKSILYSGISRIRKMLKETPYEIKQHRRGKTVWAYSIQYRPDWLKRTVQPIWIEKTD